MIVLANASLVYILMWLVFERSAAERRETALVNGTG